MDREFSLTCKNLLAQAEQNAPDLLHVKMLGGCSLSYQGNKISEQTLRYKKPWLLLAFLIVTRHQNLSQTDLLNIVYPEGKSENPVSALKTLMHRIRAMLDKLNFASGKELVLQTQGSYQWNTGLPCDLDIDIFDSLYAYAQSTTNPDEQIACYTRMAALYTGQFIPKISTETWAVSLTSHYHNRYLTAVNILCDLLHNRKQYDQIAALCEKSVRIDPYQECLYEHLIHAYVDAGNQRTALQTYRNMTDLFFRELGISPSEQLTTLYRDIVKSLNEPLFDLQSIQLKLREDSNKIGAFYCEYEIFKDIYRLFVRSGERTGDSLYLCLITLQPANGSEPSQRLFNSTMDKLRQGVCDALRRGDLYTQYSVSQYLLLLQSITAEACEKVTLRILHSFRKKAPSCPLQPHFTILPVDYTLF